MNQFNAGLTGVQMLNKVGTCFFPLSLLALVSLFPSVPICPPLCPLRCPDTLVVHVVREV